MSEHVYHVTGMHCAACKTLIERKLGREPFVHHVVVDEQTQTVRLQTDGQRSGEDLLQSLNAVLAAQKHQLSETRLDLTQDDFWTALPIGLLMILLFVLLQQSGLIQFNLGGAITPASSFVIGLVASVSSCLAVVGGLVLSLSAEVAEVSGSGQKTARRPFYFFHIGRLASFAVLGGMLGWIGQSIGVNFTISALLGLLSSLVMVVLGLHLMGLIKRNRFTLPPSVLQWFDNIEHKTFAPLLIGMGTFFLPCGFTQSMQVAALSSGSWWTGAMTMLFFALGTMPMLALLSLSSVSFAQSRHAPVFLKSAGVVVVGLGLLTLATGLTSLGLMPALFNL